jgi:hypothetical protein
MGMREPAAPAAELIRRVSNHRFRLGVYSSMHRTAAVLLLCLVALPGQGQERPLPDQTAFLQEVRKRLETDQERQSGYMYVETRREQKLDKSGRATSESVKVFESYPGLPGEERWARLVSEDGRAVPARDLEKVDRERRQHVEEYARKLAGNGPSERAKQDRERERTRRERNEAIEDVVRVFDIKMIGREAIDGHDTIAFSLTPRAGVKPRTRAGSLMQNFACRAWISESDYELVRLDAESIDTVSFGLGVLARLHKGSRVSFQRRKVNGETWLPASVKYSVAARVGLVAVMRRAATFEYSGYKKFSVDSKFQIAPPPGSRE